MSKLFKPGWYFTGMITQASIDSMPEEKRASWPLNTPMSNVTPCVSKCAARRRAEAHKLRDIQTVKV